MRLRVRGPQGVAQITIDDNATWDELHKQMQEKTGVPDFDVKYGYPPQPLNTESISGDMKLSDLPIKLNGEQLILMPRNIQAELSAPLAGSTKPSTEAVKPLPKTSQPPSHKPSDFPASTTDLDPPSIPCPQLEGTMLLRVMPDDNSCLFRAVSSAVYGSTLDTMHELRSLITTTILSDPTFYNAGILGMEPEAYCARLMRPETWGGYIELHALSRYFEMEFVSLDVQSLRADRYNEAAGRRRCFLVYSGIHYDVLAVTPYVGADPELDRKVFDVIKFGGEGEGEEVVEEDGGAMEAALQLCKELQRRHYYTDTAGFDVKCNVCGEGGMGEKWALTHAKATGHTDFGEGA